MYINTEVAEALPNNDLSDAEEEYAYIENTETQSSWAKRTIDRM
jgi:hypothetical protein